MSNNKAIVLDNIPIEVWKNLGDKKIERLAKLFNKITKSEQMPCTRSTLIVIYKNKRDIQNCVNYKEVKLMSHNIIMRKSDERRLRKEAQVTDDQFDFMSRRSTIKEIYFLRHVMERYQMHQ